MSHTHVPAVLLLVVDVNDAGGLQTQTQVWLTPVWAFSLSDSRGWSGGWHSRRLWGPFGCLGDASRCVWLSGGDQSDQGETLTVGWRLDLVPSVIFPFERLFRALGRQKARWQKSLPHAPTDRLRACLKRTWQVGAFGESSRVTVWNVCWSLVFSETGRSVIHDLQSEVSGDYGKALLILAEVPKTFEGCDRPYQRAITVWLGEKEQQRQKGRQKQSLKDSQRTRI